MIVNGRPGMSRTKKHIKRAMYLAFVPPADVPRAWLEINALFPHDVRFDNFVLYFERTWVGSTTRRPSYPIERWNQRDRILQELMTTNNNIEGFHHGFITLVGYNNPTIWDWIDAVKDRETLAFTDTWRHLSNQKPEKRYPAAVNRQVLLKAHLPNFSTLDIFNYLDGCNIAM